MFRETPEVVEFLFPMLRLGGHSRENSAVMPKLTSMRVMIRMLVIYGKVEPVDCDSVWKEGNSASSVVIRLLGVNGFAESF